MNNEQLTGYTANGKREQATAEKHLHRWQITAYEKGGEIDFCGYYPTKAQADLAYRTLKGQHAHIEMLFVGGQSND